MVVYCSLILGIYIWCMESELEYINLIFCCKDLFIYYIYFIC